MKFDGRVAIVTGAGGGLGREHALALARRGARVVVNDLGGARDGSGGSATAAEAVVAEITAAGGEAMASAASVTDFSAVQAMTAEAMDRWGRVDILVNNAGVLRDRTFAKMELDDFRFVVDVHLMGAVNCTKAVWDIMRERNYGRIVMTTSSSGLYGNFGQSNYGAAKAGIYGLMRVLAIEGRKYNIRVMGLAPGAFTRMTADLPGRQGKEPDPMSLPENIAPGVLYMASDLAADHSGKVLGVSSRGVREIKMLQTDGFNPGRPYTAQDVADNADKVFFPAAQERTAATA